MTLPLFCRFRISFTAYQLTFSNDAPQYSQTCFPYLALVSAVRRVLPITHPSCFMGIPAQILTVFLITFSESAIFYSILLVLLLISLDFVLGLSLRTQKKSTTHQNLCLLLCRCWLWALSLMSVSENHMPSINWRCTLIWTCRQSSSFVTSSKSFHGWLLHSENSFPSPSKASDQWA